MVLGAAKEPDVSHLRVSVIIPTMDRPTFVRKCLDSLRQLQRSADEIILVDSSADDRTRKVASEYPEVIYLRNEQEPRVATQPRSKNIGMQVATGDIVAFIDDDAFVTPQWLQHLLEPYADPSVAGVCGQVIVLSPVQDHIGQVLPNGDVTGNFEASVEGMVDVDHMLGCNMSFRKSDVDLTSGFHENYPGTALREETDLCVRVKKLSKRLVFYGKARAETLPAPHSTGTRSDFRYQYFAERNHIYFLARTYGYGHQVIWRYIAHALADMLNLSARAIAGAFVRPTVRIAGLIAGIFAARSAGKDEPLLHDRQYAELHEYSKKQLDGQ